MYEKRVRKWRGTHSSGGQGDYCNYRENHAGNLEGACAKKYMSVNNTVELEHVSSVPKQDTWKKVYSSTGSISQEIRGSSKKGSLKTGDLSIVIAHKRTSFPACICHTSLFLQTLYPYSVPHTCETTSFAIHLFLPSWGSREGGMVNWEGLKVLKGNGWVYRVNR